VATHVLTATFGFDTLLPTRMRNMKYPPTTTVLHSLGFLPKKVPTRPKRTVFPVNTVGLSLKCFTTGSSSFLLLSLHASQEKHREPRVPKLFPCFREPKNLSLTVRDLRFLSHPTNFCVGIFISVKVRSKASPLDVAIHSSSLFDIW